MKRGRRSAADLSVVTPIGKARPAPPENLTEAQQALWRDIVDRMPADWFPRETWPVLTAYVRHIETANFLSALIDEFTPDWVAVDGGVERLQKLTQMRDRETRGLIAAARSLRLTKTAQVRPETAGRAARDAREGPPPWDYDTTRKDANNG